MMMETVRLYNMIMIEDITKHRVVIQHRIKSWRGVAFPGGKVEPGESLIHSAIRETKEETGLDIEQLELRGIKNYFDEQVRHVVLLYYTSHFSGDLKTETAEGAVEWAALAEIQQYPLASNFRFILDLYQNPSFTEIFVDPIGNENQLK